MKRVIIIALALVTFNAFAQQKRERGIQQEHISEIRKEMTPQDVADLKTKQLTLKLDLTDVQQKEVHQLILDQAKTRAEKRKAHQAKVEGKKEKPSKDEFVKMQTERLDAQIEMKRNMKAILNTEQYAKFEKMKPRKGQKRGKRTKKE
ncbi:MAG: hypothetical protein AB8B52_06010 [Winogradskyella sp.]|uniref:hypothetical protein n=1 Tax=Winogradskyella sp. TaxID=1883156 RepID=UPI003859F8A7